MTAARALPLIEEMVTRRSAQSVILISGGFAETSEGLERAIRLRIPPPPRAGERVLTLENLYKSYDEDVIYAGVDFHLQRGEKVARSLAGVNFAIEVHRGFHRR